MPYVSIIYALQGTLIGLGIGTTGSIVNQILGHCFELLVAVDVLTIALCSVLFQGHQVDPAAFVVLPLFLITQPKLIRGLQRMGRSIGRDILTPCPESKLDDLSVSSSSSGSSSGSGSSEEDLTLTKSWVEPSATQ